MTGLFSRPKKPKTPEQPKETRMPLRTDPSVRQRRLGTIEAMRKRKGFRSNLLTDMLSGRTGGGLGG